MAGNSSLLDGRHDPEQHRRDNVANNPSFGIDVVVDATGHATVKVDSNTITEFMTGVRWRGAQHRNQSRRFDDHQ